MDQLGFKKKITICAQMAGLVYSMVLETMEGLPSTGLMENPCVSERKGFFKKVLEPMLPSMGLMENPFVSKRMGA